MKKIVLDTNMLLVPGQFKLDIFTEMERIMDEPYTLVVLESSLGEIEKMEEGGSVEDRRAAKLAKMLVDQQKNRNFSASEKSQCKGLKIVQGSAEEYVDDAIVAIAEDDTLVATNDGELKRRLLERGNRVIFLKQGQYLEIA